MRVKTNLFWLLAVGYASLATAASAQTIVPAQPKPPVSQYCFAASGCERTQPATVCFAATGAINGTCAQAKPSYTYASSPGIAKASAAVTAARVAPPKGTSTTTP